MTDLVLPTVRTLDVATDAARARVRARYRAEARFQFYGLAAIGLTAVFLVVVLADIVIRGFPAFWQHSSCSTSPSSAAEIDPQGTRDPAVIRGGDFQAAGAQCAACAVPGRRRSGRPPPARRHPVVGGLRRPARAGGRRSVAGRPDGQGRRCCSRTMPTSTTRASAPASSAIPAAESLPERRTGRDRPVELVQRLRVRCNGGQAGPVRPGA